MKGGETDAHRTLKRLAFNWARGSGLPLIGSEVRVPQSGFRADLAAASRHPAGPGAVVALFECKQSRSDLLRDHADEPSVRAAATAIAERVRRLRLQLASHLPNLRRGESLFPEFDSYDLDGIRHDTLHGLERELELLQRKLSLSTKFSRLHRYHAADYLYLVTEPGLLFPHEVPNGWGWLVRDGESLRLAEPPVRHAPTAASRLAWLEAMALSGTASCGRMLGATPMGQAAQPRTGENGRNTTD